MSNDILLTGLSLIQDSPFKSALPNPNNHAFPTASHATSPLMNRYDDKSFSNLLGFLKADYDDHVASGGAIASPGGGQPENDLNVLNDLYKYYLSELSSVLNEENGTVPHASLKNIKISDNIKSLFGATKNSNTNDLILKILIENAMYNLDLFLELEDELSFMKASLKKEENVSKHSNREILSLDEIKSLKKSILSLLEEKKRLENTVSESTDALKDVLHKYESQDSSSTQTYQPGLRQSRLEIENISLLNNKLERKLIGSALEKYMTAFNQLQSTTTKLEEEKKRLFLHFYTCLVLGYINNITVNLKLRKNIILDNLSPANTPKLPTFPESFWSPLVLPLLKQKALSLVQLVENKTAIFNKSIDEIVSFIALLAVQRDVHLPEPADKRSSMMVSDYSYTHNEEILTKTAWVKNCITKLLDGPEPRENVHRHLPSLLDTSVASGDFGHYRSPAKTNDLRSSSITGEVSDLRTKIKDLKFANDYLTKQFKTERELFNKILNEQNIIKMGLERKLGNSISNLEKTNQLFMQTDKANQQLEKKLDENFKTINELKREITRLKIEGLGKEEDEGVGMSAGIMRGEFKRIVEEMNKKHYEELNREVTERKRLESLVGMYKEKLNL